jgi:peptidoglycan/LPS O-acetylase OafA/YrhL
MPALDGVRALAVAAVLLYHGEVSWAQGGYLGVAVGALALGRRSNGSALRRQDR